MISKIIRYFFDKISLYVIRLKYPFVSKRSRIVKLKTIKCQKDNLKIGNDFFAGEGLYVSLSKYTKLVIGKAVMFGPEVMILGGNHKYSVTDSHLRYYSTEDEKSKGITIEDGAWVGARVTILSGSMISEGAIIGACSLVNKFVPPYTIAYGVPASNFKPRFKSIPELQNMLNNVNSSYQVSDILETYQNHGIKFKNE